MNPQLFQYKLLKWLYKMFKDRKLETFNLMDCFKNVTRDENWVHKI